MDLEQGTDVLEVELAPVPPPVRARRYTSGQPPAPTGQGNTTWRSPQASANPVALLGPVGVIASTPKSTRRVFALIALLAAVGIFGTIYMVTSEFAGAKVVTNLESGECLRDFLGSGGEGELKNVFLVKVVPCNQVHALEVFETGAGLWDSSDPFPGRVEAFDVGQRWCLQRRQELLGVAGNASSLAVWAIVPGESSWSGGDRTVRCLIGQSDGVMLSIGSVYESRT